MFYHRICFIITLVKKAPINDTFFSFFPIPSQVTPTALMNYSATRLAASKKWLKHTDVLNINC